MELEVSTMIARPVSTVWEFYAVHHAENHPRWDPSFELEPTSDDPIGVGTLIRRRANRFGKMIEGTMEVVGFEPEKSMRVTIQEGGTIIHGRAIFEAHDGEQTKLTIGGEFPGLDGAMAETIRPLMERSASNIQSLVESET
ncbi:MAG TPA: SRPBCC family protein [Acidimicrobiia bacterium]|nr:SRPBCC family protein [Acidimicrobiia bacterium]